jgi:ribosomal protein L37AE/L43A
MPQPPFPKSVSEFQTWFGTDQACLRYLIDSQWPDGYRCPRCGHGEAYELTSRAILKCRKCGYQASVPAGTVLHATRLPLTKWFLAAYLVATYTPAVKAGIVPWDAEALPHSRGVAYKVIRSRNVPAGLADGVIVSDDGPRQHNSDRSQGPLG